MLLPDPLTPVTTIILPKGKSTSISFKLFPEAPVTDSDLPLPCLLSSGIGIDRIPDKYCPVIDFLDSKILFGGPEKIISPPCSPAPGPMSIN